jgi:poly(3-hydroxybutyrate) depolymerase
MQASTLRLLLLSWVLAWPQFVSASSLISIAPGADSFVFADEKGDPTKAITVFTYLPKNVNASTAPIVFVLHGHHRTAQAYRDTWAAQADKYGFMVLAPRFDTEQWGSGQYSYASVIGKDGVIRDPSKWSFSVIEHLFDAVKATTGNANPRYFIFGFSEGGQFVHRLVLLMPEARYAKAVVGTPGWYTMPRFDISFPYGVGGSPVTEASLKTSLGRNVLVMLGGADTDPKAKDLRTTPEAMAQGSNRFARGLAFYREAEKRAAEYKIPLAWRLQVILGAAHEPSKMADPAAEFLMGR